MSDSDERIKIAYWREHAEAAITLHGDQVAPYYRVILALVEAVEAGQDFVYGIAPSDTAAPFMRFSMALRNFDYDPVEDEDIDEAIAAEQRLADTLEQYVGKWVAVRNHQVVHSRDTIEEMIALVKGDDTIEAMFHVSEGGGRFFPSLVPVT